MSTPYEYSDSSLQQNIDFDNTDFPKFMEKFQDEYSKLIRTVNDKDYGLYSNNITITGQKRFKRTLDLNTENEQSAIYRVVVDIGALLNNNVVTKAHGISCVAATEIVRLYGAANQPSTSYIPLPYVAAAPIYLYMDATNVYVRSTDDKTMYTVCTVTIEYI